MLPRCKFFPTSFDPLPLSSRWVLFQWNGGVCFFPSCSSAWHPFLQVPFFTLAASAIFHRLLFFCSFALLTQQPSFRLLAIFPPPSRLHFVRFLDFRSLAFKSGTPFCGLNFWTLYSRLKWTKRNHLFFHNLNAPPETKATSLHFLVCFLLIALATFQCSPQLLFPSFPSVIFLEPPPDAFLNPFIPFSTFPLQKGLKRQ